MKPNILVIDDDLAVVELLTETIRDHGWTATGETDARAGLARAVEGSFDVVMVDMVMPDMSGLDVLRAIHTKRPDQLVVMATAFGTIELAVTALRSGASDFITKPFDMAVMFHAIERVMRERELRREIVKLTRALSGEHDGLVARSSAMRKVIELAGRVAEIDATVLLTGESGVGKGAVAAFIHGRSERARGPLLSVNCAALPATLVESELFGAKKGAFTDAQKDRPGLFEKAKGGTLFLDEVGELPLDVQPKLLHALEQHAIRPVGATDTIATDIRLLAATNRPLEDALRERRFRPDLYYRLNVVRIEIPPLRERVEDIEPLVAQFLDDASKRFKRAVTAISRSALAWLVQQPWPGNVRELRHAIERAVALAQNDTLLPSDFDGQASDSGVFGDLDQPLVEMERRYITQILARCGGNKVKAAQVLGIDRRTLYRKLGETES